MSCKVSNFESGSENSVITGDLKLSTTPLRDVHKYREPKSINWKLNFKILMDSVEDYAPKMGKT
jgi:hypothetical protein